MENGIYRIKELLDKLNQEDIYQQPIDSGHLQGMIDVITFFKSFIRDNKTVLDLGCGQGIASKHFEKLGLDWTGVNLGEDYKICKLLGLQVIESDITFLDLPENSYDLGFARHILEHSPMPLITLMNLHNILKKELLIILPNPSHYKVYGRNHYSVQYENQWEWHLSRAGWRIINKQIWPEEYWFYCLKDKPRHHAPYNLTEYNEMENLT